MTEEENSLVEKVHKFWFGGSLQVNYKTKWFPDGSTDLQATADRIVFEQFGDVFYFALQGQYMHWQDHARSCIALIVVLDQFSRHICRLKGKEETEADQRRADELALSVARRMHGDSESSELLSLSVAEYVFSLMPLRHSATVDNLSFVLERLEGKEAVEAKAVELLNRFRKQTVRRLQHLQDRAKLEATSDILERDAFVADESDIMSHPLVRTTEAFLTEHLGFAQASATAGRKGVSRGGKGSIAGATCKTSDRERGGGGGCSAPSVTLLISLSGGVDSMVISKILRLLQIHRPQLRIARIMAVHIDYGNRPESAEEAAYIQRWCEGDPEGHGEVGGEEPCIGASGINSGGDGSGGEGQTCGLQQGGGSRSRHRSAMLGGVLCRVRRVDEVTRGVTSRDEYEKVSRDIRYGFYKVCIEEARQLMQADGEAEGEAEGERRISGVIFGHHLGDVQENVISNVMRGSGPLQLSGMTARSVTNGVAVWRPLLAHTKDAIYDFAHRYGVPYFKDSTPSWSTRGKLRNQLLPLLLDMYGSGCLHNLTQLALESDATRALVQDNLYEPFMRSVQRHPCGVSVNVLPYRDQPQCFWREALRQLMHSMNMAMVRDSAVGNFVERLQRGASSARSGVLAGWLELRKGAHSYLTAEGQLVVLRDGVFRRNASSALSSTTLNQRRQQALSQARKQRLAAGGLSTAAMVDAAQQQAARLQAELERAVTGLLTVRLDLATGQLSCDPAVLRALCTGEYPDACCDRGSPPSAGSTGGETLRLGPWTIECSLRSPPVSDHGAGAADACSDLSGLASVLPGSFSYDISLPGSAGDAVGLQLAFQRSQVQNLCEEAQLQSGVLAELTAGGAGAAAAAIDGDLAAAANHLPPLSLPGALAAMDGRIRSGLPLFGVVGVGAERMGSGAERGDGDGEGEGGVAGKLILRVTARYEG